MAEAQPEDGPRPVRVHRSLSVACTHTACSAARQVFVDSLAAHGVREQDTSMAAMALGELLSNAVRHGRAREDGLLCVTWGFTDRSVRVAVQDGGDVHSLTAALPVDRAATSGRGLWLIEQIATEWGCEDVGGTEVWALLPAVRRASGER